MLFSLITINHSSISSNNSNVSALSYSSSVGIGFTFNPTLSVSISPSDLVISNLVPGNTLDSNVINVSVASNASYGYTLSAIVNGNNSNLTHSNGTNTFSSIATNADLSDLDNSEDTNIWGYSYKDNTVETPTWSNYNGLSSSVSTTLLNTNSNNSNTINNIETNSIDSIDFKIAAKAASTQASGIYTDTINFTAVTNVAPMSLLDSFLASGAEQLNGYFKMQDMTHDICINVDIEESELQLIDVRDNKIYWIAKLKDGNCWMTQNLDLDLSHEVALTSENTNLKTYAQTGPYSPEGGYYQDDTNTIYWTPIRSTTFSLNRNNFPATVDANNTPYSYDPSSLYYYYGPPSNPANHTFYSLSTCQNENYPNCERYPAGNYYNWSAAVASDNTIGFTETNTYADNSICPKNWKLPTSNNFNTLTKTYNINNKNSLDLQLSPLWFVRSGYIQNGGSSPSGTYGCYWTNISSSDGSSAQNFSFFNGFISSTNTYQRNLGLTVRCITE